MSYGSRNVGGTSYSSETVEGDSFSSSDTISPNEFSSNSTPGTTFSSCEMTGPREESGYAQPDETFYSEMYSIDPRACVSAPWSSDETFWTPETIMAGPCADIVEPHIHETNSSGTEFPTLSSHEIGPCFSRPMFYSPGTPIDFPSQDNLKPWTSVAQEITPPQTVMPSATIQNLCTGSPTPLLSPRTPRRFGCIEHGTPLTWNNSSLHSSPETDTLSRVKHELQSKDLVDSSYYPQFSKPPRKYNTRGTNSRNVAKRKQDLHLSHNRPTESNRHKCTMNRSIITANQHKCGMEGCEKRFRRKEHLKRHKDSVHSDNQKHYCWFCGTSLSRSDNLKQHLKTTHGVKRAGKRTRYVATCDLDSPLWSPDYRGLIDKNGEPTDDVKKDALWSEKFDNRKERLRWMQTSDHPLVREIKRRSRFSKL